MDDDWVEYTKNYMKIQFNSDDILPLNKPLTIRSVFSEDNKLYPQVFLDEALYSLKKMLKYDKIDITEVIDLDKTNKLKKCIFCHYWYYLNKTLVMVHLLVMAVII